MLLLFFLKIRYLSGYSSIKANKNVALWYFDRDKVYIECERGCLL